MTVKNYSDPLKANKSYCNEIIISAIDEKVVVDEHEQKTNCFWITLYFQDQAESITIFLISAVCIVYGIHRGWLSMYEEDMKHSSRTVIKIQLIT